MIRWCIKGGRVGGCVVLAPDRFYDLPDALTEEGESLGLLCAPDAIPERSDAEVAATERANANRERRRALAPTNAKDRQRKRANLERRRALAEVEADKARAIEEEKLCRG